LIHYHGTPITPTNAAISMLKARHGLVSFANPQQIHLVAEMCQSFVLDNGAFTVWRKGGVLDVEAYADWVRTWWKHPGFDWCLIPDVIEGDEAANDRMFSRWFFCRHAFVRSKMRSRVAHA
jgi:hypothetical protein